MHRSRLPVLLLGALLLLPAGPLAAAGDIEPYVVCEGRDCNVVDGVSRENLELTAGDEYELLFVEDEDPPGDVVCLEGARGCTVRDPSQSIDDIELTYGGRVVHGRVDADPTGTWKAVNLRSKMLCKPKGSEAVSIKVKKSTDRGTITRSDDGLMGQSGRPGEAPFQLLRMGPGVYASIQPFSEAGIEGDMTSYYGMLSEDKIAGTSIIRTTVKRGGIKTTCKMDRNFNLTRIGPAPDPESPIDPTDPDDELIPDDIDSGLRDDASTEGVAIAFEEDEVEPIGGDGPAMVFEEDEAEASTE